MPWGHCVPDHTVAPSGLTSATAQEGPIIPWSCIGKLYVAFSVRLAVPSAASTSPWLSRTSFLISGDWRVAVYRSFGSGRSCGSDHLTFSSRAALIASSSRSATTPTKFAFRTTLTDGAI